MGECYVEERQKIPGEMHRNSSINKISSRTIAPLIEFI